MTRSRLVSGALGLDIGGTRCKLGLVDLSTGQTIRPVIFETEKTRESLFFERLSDHVLESLRGARADRIEVSGLGAGIGAYVFADGSLDSTWGFIPFLDRQPLAKRLSDLYGLPCRTANDTEAASRAEAMFGAGRNYERSLTITMGTGVGVGFTVDGKPQNREASIHLAGHVMVRGGGEWDGCLDPCYCPVPGCLESTCSGSAIGRLASARWRPGSDAAALFAAAREGDRRALPLVSWIVEMLSRGLNQFAYVFCPDVIILGGGVAGSLGPWLDFLRRELKARVFGGHAPEVQLAELPEMGGVVGAASLFSPDDRVNRPPVR